MSSPQGAPAAHTTSTASAAALAAVHPMPLLLLPLLFPHLHPHSPQQQSFALVSSLAGPDRPTQKACCPEMGVCCSLPSYWTVEFLAAAGQHKSLWWLLGASAADIVAACEFGLKGSDGACRGDLIKSGWAFSFWTVLAGGADAAAAVSDACALCLEGPTSNEVAVALLLYWLKS